MTTITEDKAELKWLQETLKELKVELADISKRSKKGRPDPYKAELKACMRAYRLEVKALKEKIKNGN